jgi:DNA-binding FadR family transcriptional regulator
VQLDKLDSPLLQYLAAYPVNGDVGLPTVAEISDTLGVSVGKLREELAHARGLGLVSLRPRVGMRREPFSFARVILPAILFGLATGEVTFAQMVQLRRGVEESLWDQAVARLTSADFSHLRALIAAADARLSRPQAIIPHQEHRDFHLTIFSRLENRLVQGILEAYWDVYEANEIGRYYTYAYWREVWHYHTLIVDALEAGDTALARQRLVEHFNLLQTTPRPD